MKHWFNQNYRTLIITAFLIPILTVALVSISHVTKWYGISNPVTWSIYLSIGVEIAALSALAAISAKMGKKVYVPFAIVTLVQFIGNIYFAYDFVDVTSKSFIAWVELVSPIVEFMGIDSNDYVGHRRFLALFAGGMLPVISLSFLHMLVKFTEEDRMKEVVEESDIRKELERLKEDELKLKEEEQKLREELEQLKSKPEPEAIESKELISEISRVRISETDLSLLEQILNNPPKPNEELKTAAIEYKEFVDDKINEVSEPLVPEVTKEENNEPVVEEIVDDVKHQEFLSEITEENKEEVSVEEIVPEEVIEPVIEEEEVIPTDTALDNEPEIEITSSVIEDEKKN